MKKAYITTKDNPWDPSDLDQLSKWWIYDVQHGYNSCAYLGRIAKTSDSLSDEENDREVERAIDEIIRLDPFDVYRKVIR